MVNEMSLRTIKKRVIILFIALGLSPILMLIMISWRYPKFILINPSIITSYSSLIVISLILSSIGLFIFYHCAFRKRGTRLLTFSIFSGIITVFWNFLSFIIFLVSIMMFPESMLSGYRLSLVGSDIEIINFLFEVSIYCDLFMLVLYCFLVLYLYRLRKKNNLYQYKSLMKSDYYKQGFNRLKTASDLQELDSIYKELSNTMSEIRKFLRFQYQKIRKQIAKS